MLAFLAMVLFQAGGPVTPPTDATNAAALQVHGVPDNAPPLTGLSPANAPPGSADAAARAALDYFNENAGSLVSDKPTTALIDGWIAKLTAAAKAGRLSPGFLDDGAKMEPAAPGKYNDALSAMANIVGGRAIELYEADKKQQAITAYETLWWWGVEGFTSSVRLRNRFLCQFLMGVSHAQLRQWSEGEETEAMKFWTRTLADLERYWPRKSEMLMILAPNIGDVIRLATEDQDPTFRMEAALKLGVLQFSPKTSSNVRAIQKAMAQAAKDSDPRVAAAAVAAQAMTRDQLQMMH